MMQPIQSQTALASRTVSWNPANFSQAANWLSEADRKGSGRESGCNSEADFAPGDQSHNWVNHCSMIQGSCVLSGSMYLTW